LEKGEVEVEVEEVGEEALLIKGSSAFMSSWSEEDDDQGLSWFVYKSMSAITKMSERLRKSERKPNLFCPRTQKWIEKKRI
jgi:hypothetical protein